MLLVPPIAKFKERYNALGIQFVLYSLGIDEKVTMNRFPDYPAERDILSLLRYIILFVITFSVSS